MSRQYNEWYFGGRDDRDHLDRAYDEWRDRIDKAQGVFKSVESLYPPFKPAQVDPLSAVANPRDVKEAIRRDWKLAREQKAQNKTRQKPKHQTRNPRKQS